MTESDVERLAELARIYIYMHTPYDTGNLRQNSLKIERIGEKSWRIFIDLDIAPYQVYLNEKPSKWHKQKTGGEWYAKKNRHYHWWEHMMEDLAVYLQTVSQGDINRELIKVREKLYNAGGKNDH